MTALISALKNNMNGGLFSYEWGGVTYHDPDTAGAALAALAAYYGKRDDATAVVDAILAALPAAMDENGSFGSANSDAMAAIGLLALGKDPAQLKTEDGVSLVDGAAVLRQHGNQQLPVLRRGQRACDGAGLPRARGAHEVL